MNTPNFRSSAYTGRAPRDMQSAFGPYTSREIEEKSEPRGFVAAVVCIGIVGLLIAWVTR